MRRRELFGLTASAIAGLIAPSITEAAPEEIGPPDGATFCRQCMPPEWEKWNLFERMEPNGVRLWNGVVHFNEDEPNSRRYIMRVREGSPGWISELQWENGEGRCSCGAGMRSYPMKITYGKVYVEWD